MKTFNAASKKSKKSPTMTRKEAVAVMYQLREAYLELSVASDTFEEATAFRLRALDALVVLAEAHFGKTGIGQSIFLCTACYSRYADLLLECKYTRLCSSCYEQQKSKNHLPQAAEVLS